MEKQGSLLSVEEYKKNFVKNKKAAKEEKVQLIVCNYLKLKFPNVIFMCDLASGLRLPIWMGALHKKMRSSRGLPDLFIAHPKLPRFAATESSLEDFLGYRGLFIELKGEGVVTHKKDGSLRSDKHLGEQNEILQRLNKLGYKAVFASGAEEAIKIIDEYLGG
jgi:hypothetical protein